MDIVSTIFTIQVCLWHQFIIIVIIIFVLHYQHQPFIIHKSEKWTRRRIKGLQNAQYSLQLQYIYIIQLHVRDSIHITISSSSNNNYYTYIRQKHALLKTMAPIRCTV